MTEILITPPLDKNPQRGDTPTPLLQKPDNSQCMGNAMQSALNWIGAVDSTLSGMVSKKFNTFNYYSVFEPWLLQHKLIKLVGEKYVDSTDQVYTLSNHVNCFNEILRANNSLYRFTYYGNADLHSLISHIQKYHRPVVLGTKLSSDGHYIRVVGCVVDDAGNTVDLKVDDPYGKYPWATAEEKSGGFYDNYKCDVNANTVMGKAITRMVTIDQA